jgi:hypothetical protein
MVNKYRVFGYQMVNAADRLAALRQFFSGKTGKNPTFV